MAFLSDELLGEIHSRAARYDAENTFPEEDYDQLRNAGYYAAFVPEEFGGSGLTLSEITAEQTRLAKAAPRTAGEYLGQVIRGLPHWEE